MINAKNKMNPEQDDIGKSKFTPFLTAEKIQGVNRGLRDFPDNLPFPPRRLFRTPHQIFLVKIWPGWVGVKSESFFKSILIVLKYIRPCWDGQGWDTMRGSFQFLEYHMGQEGG